MRRLSEISVSDSIALEVCITRAFVKKKTKQIPQPYRIRILGPGGGVEEHWESAFLKGLRVIQKDSQT